MKFNISCLFCYLSSSHLKLLFSTRNFLQPNHWNERNSFNFRFSSSFWFLFRLFRFKSFSEMILKLFLKHFKKILFIHCHTTLPQFVLSIWSERKEKKEKKKFFVKFLSKLNKVWGKLENLCRRDSRSDECKMSVGKRSSWPRRSWDKNREKKGYRKKFFTFVYKGQCWLFNSPSLYCLSCKNFQQENTSWSTHPS